LKIPAAVAKLLNYSISTLPIVYLLHPFTVQT
jgi:hypothetical protein